MGHFQAYNSYPFVETPKSQSESLVQRCLECVILFEQIIQINRGWYPLACYYPVFFQRLWFRATDYSTIDTVEDLL